jgi:hypothetical protein
MLGSVIRRGPDGAPELENMGPFSGCHGDGLVLVMSPDQALVKSQAGILTFFKSGAIVDRVKLPNRLLEVS